MSDNYIIISSFFYYMWNAWNKTECEIAFQNSECGTEHLWNKWCSICNTYGVRGAAERYFAELSEPNRLLLVARACHIYNGRERKEC